MSKIDLQAVSKKFGDSLFSLHSTSLTLENGEIFALLGPSGCGKTTLLKLIAGLLSPDYGTVSVDGIDLTPIPAERRGFGMVFQQPLLFPHLSVEQNIAFPLKMQGIAKRERINKSHDMLTSVGLTGFGTRRPAELSGGEQQRVSLARALVSRPRLLLMDEPFSALDPGLRAEMRQLVARLHRENPLTIVLVSHDREDAFSLASRMGVMSQGRLLQIGSPQELYERPSSSDVARFLGAKNVWPGVWSKDGFDVDHSELCLPAPGFRGESSQRGWLVIRPETIRVHEHSSNSPVQSEEMIHLNGTLQEMTYRQGFQYMRVAVGNVELEAVQLDAGIRTNNDASAEVTVTIDSKQLHVITELMNGKESVTC